MAYRKMTVEYILDDREIEALEELLGKWQQYKGKDGSQPFEDWKLEDLFQAIMQYGCKYDISKHIKTDQYRHEASNRLNLKHGLKRSKEFWTLRQRENCFCIFKNCRNAQT